jgi:hypothetical protein
MAFVPFHTNSAWNTGDFLMFLVISKEAHILKPVFLLEMSSCKSYLLWIQRFNHSNHAGFNPSSEFPRDCCLCSLVFAFRDLFEPLSMDTRSFLRSCWMPSR